MLQRSTYTLSFRSSTLIDQVDDALAGNTQPLGYLLHRDEAVDLPNNHVRLLLRDAMRRPSVAKHRNQVEFPSNANKDLEAHAASFCDVSEGNAEDGLPPCEIAALQQDVGLSMVIEPVGITPGVQQAAEALVVLRRALLAGKSPEEAAERAKQAASFKGTMRTLGARLMDHFGIHQLLGLSSTIDLFGSASARAHYTSTMRHPVLKGYANYSGDIRMMQRKFLRDAVVESLPSEIEQLQNPWIIPFGSAAASALEYLVEQGRLSDDRILSGILHPSGTQWNRYNVQLNLVTNQEAMMVPGGSDVIARSAKLRQKVATAIANRGT